VALTIVPKLGIDLADEPGLAAVPLRNPGIVRTLGIIARRGHPLSPAADALAGLIQAHLRQS
jgi:DNA-binding transcriptional LysR family regulator